jgi:1,4-dihydroxy-2-naphthoate octaprenyltransferase
LATWILAIRWRTLSAAVSPVLVGTGLALNDGGFHFPSAVAALAAALLIQVGTNLTNDLYDFRRGADVHRTGPPRVTTAGLLSPGAVQVGLIACFALAILIGVYLVARGGWPIVVIGLASIAAGYAYTGGPFPLAYNGLGDLAVFIFFGIVGVTGMYYLQTLNWSLWAVIAAIPVGALITNILVVNNLRDADTDRKVGKRTVAVIFGRTAARVEYVVLLVVSYLTPFVFLATGRAGPLVLAPLVSLVLAVPLARTVLRYNDGPRLNPALARSSQLALVFSVLFAAGLAL